LESDSASELSALQQTVKIRREELQRKRNCQASLDSHAGIWG